jgi:hypothetical protein
MICFEGKNTTSFLPLLCLQIDLSDDAVVSQLFGSGAWQDVIEEVKVRINR